MSLVRVDAEFCMGEHEHPSVAVTFIFRQNAVMTGVRRRRCRRSSQCEAVVYLENALT